MSESTRDPRRSSGQLEPGAAWGVGIAIGVGLGVAMGAVFDNLGMGIAVGIAIGVIFAIAFGATGSGSRPRRGEGSTDSSGPRAPRGEDPGQQEDDDPR